MRAVVPHFCFSIYSISFHSFVLFCKIMNSFSLSFRKSFSGASLCLAAIILAHSTAPQAHACAACGCTLSSDWESQGYSTASGFQVDVQYNYIDQNQLRHGSHAADPSAVPMGQELEENTTNNYITAGFTYNFNADWGVTLYVPWIDRQHTTLGGSHDSPDFASVGSLGDMRLVARYQGILANHNLGVQLGVKLPTGSFTQTFEDGQALDRELQPGSGTVDAIAGLYYFHNLGREWSGFAQLTVQTALDSRAQYKPGTSENLSLGVRYLGWDQITPAFQINGREVGRDTGAQADNYDTGGTLIYLSPGITYTPTKQISLYLFVQVPVYQNVYGWQLSPKWTLSSGVRVTF